MIYGIHHIAIIISKEEHIYFYEKLGFKIFHRVERKNDIVVLMEGYGIQLEIFVDPSHPRRSSNPENIGLRHFALKVDNINELSEKFEHGPIMKDWFGVNYCFISDPDGLPIELHE